MRKSDPRTAALAAVAAWHAASLSDDGSGGGSDGGTAMAAAARGATAPTPSSDLSQLFGGLGVAGGDGEERVGRGRSRRHSSRVAPLPDDGGEEGDL